MKLLVHTIKKSEILSIYLYNAQFSIVDFSQAVLPECRVSNFTTDWNSGVYLSALLDYCRPGLFPHWRNLNPKDR
jgi:filamin